MAKTFFWHDYETTGTDTRRDRPTQFAGIRTNENLEEIGEPLDIVCQLPADIVPSATAAILTGVMPERCARDGLPEAEFAAIIAGQMSQPGTCCVGYNSIRFDDEITRNMLFRSLRDPYEREWANGNSRWDLINLVRACHAFRPDGINWPQDEEGFTSFRLETLAQANGLIIDRAHDALSDVRTTIALARLIRDKQPRLFDHMLGQRDKNAGIRMLSDPARKPIVHVATAYGRENLNVGIILPIGPHPTNKNSFIVADLSVDPKEWLDMSAQDLADKLQWKPLEKGDQRERNLLREVQANKCPSLFPASVINTTDGRFDFFDKAQILTRHGQILGQLPSLLSRAQQAISINEARRTCEADPELSIYFGGFLGNADRAKLREACVLPPEHLAGRRFGFQDQRLDKLLFRFRARNWPDTLSAEEKAEWDAFCVDRVTNAGELGPRTLDDLDKEIAQLVEEGRLVEGSAEHGSLTAYLNEKRAWVDNLHQAPRSRPGP